MLHREPELSDRELKILRGMIDEYEYDASRTRFLRNTWTTGRTLLVTLGVILAVVTQIATLIAVLK